MVVLDTSAVSAVMHRRAGALQRLQRLEPWTVVLCSPVTAEITFGIANLEPGSRRARLLEAEYRQLRQVVRWVDWSEDAAECFGELKAALRRQGTPIDDMDVAIASVAWKLEATVATLNRRHFANIDGLMVEDWSEPILGGG